MKSLQHYIEGRWVAPVVMGERFPVIDPATESQVAEICMGSAADVDLAVAAACRAFPGFSATPLEARLDALRRINEVFKRRFEEMADAITTEMGAPRDMAREAQAASGPGHIEATIQAAQQLDWEVRIDGSNVVREPIGVCGLVTPWNWPINQILAKVAPAIAAGCTMVLKPSEQAPLSAQLIAEFIDEAGLPAGVFNLVHGNGPSVGHAMSAHPDIEMMSFTGSTRAGVDVAKTAADTIKRVAQELGGKSPNLIFADADLGRALGNAIRRCFYNTGQSCNAPTRLLVEASVYERAVELIKPLAEATKVGDPRQPGRHLGPLSSRIQFERVQRYMQIGIDEGARLVAGGPGRPEGIDRGFFVKPTVFADVHNGMRIAREEIFGPVLSMIPFKDLEDAIAIANDTPYGLAAYLFTSDLDKARTVARRLRAGSVHINGAGQGYMEPFGGFKQSGNGRECGTYGLLDFLELKSINGFYAA
ncbi:MAG: aldehyde dehydrogenase family protein [Xanthomonadales bacterium]|jgi:aldehyde dehydrogenase (NAD+)|nr:aldehyde dehydrogenase family protein [Xanthomonadales bacterium]